MRVTTAFNRMLGLPGAWVRDVEFGERAVIVTVALRRKQPICSGCGARGLKIKDHRVKRWRHLDVGGVRCAIECRLRRLYCPGCGELPEHVEWARGGARYTRDFDDLTAWLAQQITEAFPWDEAPPHLVRDNDGAYGEYTFDVTERTITLDYNERHMESDHSMHVF